MYKETLSKRSIKQGLLLEQKGEGRININSNIAKNEPHLINVGQNTTIAGNVEFITHDNSTSKVIPISTDLFGKIIIGRNCFIGAISAIMYDITIADDVILASESVVTKFVKENNVIVANNLANVISTWEKIREK